MVKGDEVAPPGSHRGAMDSRAESGQLTTVGDGQSAGPAEWNAGLPPYVGRYRVPVAPGPRGLRPGLSGLRRAVGATGGGQGPASAVSGRRAKRPRKTTSLKLVRPLGWDHPNIVPVYDVGSSPDCPCFICAGLLYGPTGCGKSSLVKAGLMPGLAEHVLAVYVEATATDRVPAAGGAVAPPRPAPGRRLPGDW